MNPSVVCLHIFKRNSSVKNSHLEFPRTNAHKVFRSLLPLSGRCFVRYKSAESFQEVPTSSSSIGSSESAISGNNYYSSQFRALRCQSSSSGRVVSRSISSSPAVINSIIPGDILLDFRQSTVVHSRDKRCVDVSGVSTSFIDAPERSLHAKATLPELLRSMQWHDGSSVPELRRGNMPIGSILVLAAGRNHHYSSTAMKKRMHSSPFSNTLTNVDPMNDTYSDNSLEKHHVRNGSSFFCERRALEYYSMEEALSLVEVIAERCRLVAPRCVLQPITLAGCREVSEKAIRESRIHRKFLKKETGTQGFLIKVASNY